MPGVGKRADTTAQDDGIVEVVEDVAREVGARDEPGAQKVTIYRDPVSAATRTVVSRGGRTSAQSRSLLFTNASIRAASVCG
jgi:hypothetical protein